ncbi:hypothetical protein [Thalassobellus suaedae]|uniref:Uncharacterized protein n=1 Tax=Thalassobellus suaedae TaxID=3074124 RepID=A0ABY9Y436_9FLAO|nr:hypothetical protein RHP49_01790 [Flavobacteriaceae bacterium HL-DH10]
MEIQVIKNELINCCLNDNSKQFIPYLLSKKVKTGMPNKTRFYSFFKSMLKCAKQNSIGIWTLKIEKTNWNDGQNTLAYNFYDERHKYARLTLMVTEKNGQILFETMPF